MLLLEMEVRVQFICIVKNKSPKVVLMVETVVVEVISLFEGMKIYGHYII